MGIGLLLVSVSPTARPAPAWFANLQLEITNVLPLSVTESGLLADVTFTGTAGGPVIKDATVAGVDHVLFEFSGDAQLNVYLTITDIHGDQVSAHISGRATALNPGRYVLEETVGTIVNETDPHTGAFHATTGRYAPLIGATFDDVGFISGFSLFPPAGAVHAKWYLH